MVVLNMAQCKKCGVVVVSTHRHDYRTCKCGAIAVDGGRDYVRLAGNPDDIYVLTVTKGEDGFFHFPTKEIV